MTRTTFTTNEPRARVRGRLARGVIVAVGMSLAMPVAADPLGPNALLVRGKKKRKKSKKDVFTPAMAAEEREPAQQAAAPLRDAGELVAAASGLDTAAAKRGDPILFLDAGDLYLEEARKTKEIPPAQEAIARGAIARDVLYFQLDPGSSDDFRVVEKDEIPDLLERANQLQEDGQALIDEIEEERRAAETAANAPAPQKKKRKSDPVRVATITGATLTAIGGVLVGLGVTGLGLGAVRQQEAEDPTVYGNDYDAVAEKGKRANTLAIVGLTAGAAFLAGGIAALVIAARKRRAAGDEDVPAADDEETASATLAPHVGPRSAGLVLTGRF